MSQSIIGRESVVAKTELIEKGGPYTEVIEKRAEPNQNCRGRDGAKT